MALKRKVPQGKLLFVAVYPAVVAIEVHMSYRTDVIYNVLFFQSLKLSLTANTLFHIPMRKPCFKQGFLNVFFRFYPIRVLVNIQPS